MPVLIKSPFREPDYNVADTLTDNIKSKQLQMRRQKQRPEGQCLGSPQTPVWSSATSSCSSVGPPTSEVSAVKASARRHQYVIARTTGQMAAAKLAPSARIRSGGRWWHRSESRSELCTDCGAEPLVAGTGLDIRRKSRSLVHELSAGAYLLRTNCTEIQADDGQRWQSLSNLHQQKHLVDFHDRERRAFLVLPLRRCGTPRRIRNHKVCPATDQRNRYRPTSWMSSSTPSRDHPELKPLISK